MNEPFATNEKDTSTKLTDISLKYTKLSTIFEILLGIGLFALFTLLIVAIASDWGIAIIVAYIVSIVVDVMCFLFLRSLKKIIIYIVYVLNPPK